MDVKREYIVCAANWYYGDPDARIYYNHQPSNIKYGYVICGFRHNNCIQTKYLLSGLKIHDGRNLISGFLTSKNRFVDRKEAYEIADSQNQIVHKSGNLNERILYSEDIY